MEGNSRSSEDTNPLQSLGSILTGIQRRKKIQLKCKDCGESFETADRGRFTASLCCPCAEKKLKAEEEMEKRREAEEVARQTSERIGKAHFTEEWRNVSFESADPKINPGAFRTCRKYAEDFHPKKNESLFIWSSQYGSGKTYLAVCVGKYILHQKKMRVRFQKARDLMIEIRHTYSDEARQDEYSLLQSILSFDLLILDDVGVDNPTDWLSSTYWTLIDSRMGRQLPVVVTSNYSLYDTGKDEVLLGDRIGFGAVSRLRRMCGDNAIQLKGKDLR